MDETTEYQRAVLAANEAAWIASGITSAMERVCDQRDAQWAAENARDTSTALARASLALCRQARAAWDAAAAAHDRAAALMPRAGT